MLSFLTEVRRHIRRAADLMRSFPMAQFSLGLQGSACDDFTADTAPPAGRHFPRCDDVRNVSAVSDRPPPLFFGGHILLSIRCVFSVFGLCLAAVPLVANAIFIEREAAGTSDPASIAATSISFARTWVTQITPTRPARCSADGAKSIGPAEARPRRCPEHLSTAFRLFAARSLALRAQDLYKLRLRG